MTAQETNVAAQPATAWLRRHTFDIAVLILGTLLTLRKRIAGGEGRGKTLQEENS